MAKSKGTSEYAPPKSDAYTGLLIISLLALIAGCTFLYLDWSQYSKTKPQLPGSASTSRPGAGQPQPGAPSSGGMSPTTMALIGLLAYKAMQYLGNQPGQQPSTRAQQPTVPGNPAAGAGLGGLLGGLLGGGAGGGAATGDLGHLIQGGLGSLLGGAGAGGLLTGGLGKLLQDFQNSRQSGAIQSWIGNGPNQPIEPSDLESALGKDTLDALAKQTGMNREDLLAHLSQNLPELVDRLTPNGRLPTQEEAARLATS